MKSTKYFFPIFILSFFLTTYSKSQEQLTNYIVSKALKYSQEKFPNKAPHKLHIKKSRNFSPIKRDTIFIPYKYWGFNSSQNYGLHFYASFLIFFDILQQNNPDDNLKIFFYNSGRSASFALNFINEQERGRLLDQLVINKYVYSELSSNNKKMKISENYNKNDTLRYFSMLYSILCYRTDSLNYKTWIHTDRFIDYSILNIIQVPLKGNKFKVVSELQNNGDINNDFELLFDLSKKDTILNIKGFKDKKTITYEFESSLLKGVIDPYKKIFDTNIHNQAFVSDEFIRKRRVFSIFSIFIWDLLSMAISFVLLLFAGIMFHRLSTLFYQNNLAWIAIFTFLTAIIKIFMPNLLYGFNIWGFVYYIHLISNTISGFWIALSIILVTFLVYYIFIKDEAKMTKLNNLLKFILVVSLLEPFLCYIGI